MSIVNFAVTPTLDRRIRETMRTKGFVSKAEFFRFAALHFIDIVDKPLATEEERLGYLTDALTREVGHAYRHKKIASLKDQLADL